MYALEKNQEAVVTKERALIESLMEFLAGFGAPDGDVELLRQTLSDMAAPFLLVIVGEFNAGKSAFVNALLGDEIAREGSLPTADQVTILKYSPEPTSTLRDDGVTEMGYPNDLLRAVSVVDTPGTNAVIREHEEISREFVPRSDMVLFVTSVERPFSESEREYMRMISDWGKKIVIVVNKKDVLPAPEVDAIQDFVRERVTELLGLTPPVFMVSAKTARKAKAVTGQDRRDLMEESGFGDLEAYMANLMGEDDLVNLKLQSPLGVADQLVGRYLGAAGNRSQLLEEDTRMVENLEGQLGTYRDETRRDFEVRLGQITLAVSEINERADRFFEEGSGFGGSILGGLFGRGGGGNVQERFREEVVADTGEVIDRRAKELVNWLVYRNLKQWRTVVDYIELHRKADLTRRLVGETIADDFNGRREGLLQSIIDDSTQAVQGFDHREEAQRLTDVLQDAVSKTAVREAEATGFGKAAGELAATTTGDITGTTHAVMMAGLEAGKGRKGRDEFRQRTRALRERLNEAVQRQLEAELETSVQQMRETIVPYVNFVNSELRRMKTTESILGKLGVSVRSLEETVAVTEL